MEKLDYCFHTHTFRCGHASGADEEYVVKAIECGIKRLGFSDHIMLPSPLIQRGIRGSYEQYFEDYLKSINYLKEKYKDQIEITVGFEAEFYHDFINNYKWLLDNRIDYLIIGQHCFLNEDEKFEWYFWQDCPIDRVIKYTDELIEGMRSGLFKYVCHPDLFVCSYQTFTDELKEQSLRIIDEAERLHIPLEINCHGGKFQRSDYLNYPCDEFWELVSGRDIDVVIGVDAHNPNEFDLDNMQKALDFAKKHNLRLVENYDILEN